VIEHEKPYLARAQLIASLNDKQSVSYPIDYPRFDQNAKLTNMNVCKGLTSQLGYLVFFKNHFSHLKKFVSQLMKIESLDEYILQNESKLDQYFMDQNSMNQSQQIQQNCFVDKLCLLYSPLRATKCFAFQCIQSKDSQYTHQVQNDLHLMLLMNSGVYQKSATTTFDVL